VAEDIPSAEGLESRISLPPEANTRQVEELVVLSSFYAADLSVAEDIPSAEGSSLPAEANIQLAEA